MSKDTVNRVRGDTYPIEATLTKGGSSVDFSAGNNTAKFSYTKGTNTVTIDGVNGDVNGNISFPFPKSIFSGTYKYDIQITTSAGEVRTYVTDEMIISNDVTK